MKGNSLFKEIKIQAFFGVFAIIPTLDTLGTYNE
jgi:hypothetical protein